MARPLWNHNGRNLTQIGRQKEIRSQQQITTKSLDSEKQLKIKTTTLILSKSEDLTDIRKPHLLNIMNFVRPLM